MRETIATRREAYRFRFYHDGFQYVATCSFYNDGRLAELFFSLPKCKGGTALESVARDAAILASLCLQYGATEEDLRHSLTRLEQDEPAGPVCRFLDILALQRKQESAA